MANSESKPESLDLGSLDRPGEEKARELVVPVPSGDGGSKTEGIRALAHAVTDSKAAPIKTGKRFPWWAPSMSDLFILAFFGWAFLSGVNQWPGLLADADSGWHIRTGEFILANHVVPVKDLFSFSKPDGDWYAWEWLTDVIWAKLFLAMGLRGICWFAGVMIATYTAILLRFSLSMGSSLFVAMMLVLIGSGASSVHYLARPHVFTLVFLPITVWLIEADRRKRTNWIFVTIPMAIVWVNLHGGFPTELLALGATAVGCAIEAYWNREGESVDWGPCLRYSGITAVAALATLINPYGIRLHQHLYFFLTSDWIRDNVDEFRSPNFRGASMLEFELLMYAGVAAAALLLRRRKVVEALWIVGFCHMSLISIRHVSLYAAVVAPYLAREVTVWFRECFGTVSKGSFAGICRQIDEDLIPAFNRTTFWLPLVLVLIVFLPTSVAHWPVDYPSIMFPTGMVNKHQSELAAARVLTTDQWADYLIFKSYPVQKVFFDGRSDFYGPEIGNQCMQALEGTTGWKETLDKHRFQYVLAPKSAPLTELLRLDKGWTVLDDDGKVILFQRLGEARS